MPGLHRHTLVVFYHKFIGNMYMNCGLYPCITFLKIHEKAECVYLYCRSIYVCEISK